MTQDPPPRGASPALTVEVAVEVAFAHELGDDVHGLLQGAHGVQLDQLLMPQALQVLNLLGEVLCFHVSCGRKPAQPL